MLPEALIESIGVSTASQFLIVKWREHQLESFLRRPVPGRSPRKAHQLLLVRRKLERAKLEVEMCESTLQDFDKAQASSSIMAQGE